MTTVGNQPVWALLLDARSRAGLTQAALAARAGTSQAAVARYERARAMPDVDTIVRLLDACGFQLRWELLPVDRTDERQLLESLARSPGERVEANRRISRLAAQSSMARRSRRVRRLVDG